MVRRSVLFTPGDRPEMLRKAPEAGADAIVFDLEDAVAPQRKDEARAAVREVLSDPAFDPDCEVCLRVNPIGVAAGDDLAGVIGGDGEAIRLDGVVLPKTESGDDVKSLARRLRERDVRVPVLALIESARGVLAAEEIADAAPTDALVFGAEDLSADVGATRTREGTEVLYARQRVVIAAAANDCTAIDTVFTDFGDTEGLREEAAFAVRLGYDGKMAIHPSQVEPINEAFTPDEEEIEWADAVMAGKRAADAEGRGVFEVDGQMIDAPLIARAQRILGRAEAAGKRD